MPTPVFFSKFVQRQHNGAAADLDAAAVVKVALITATWTPNQQTDDDASGTGIRANEVSGTGYTAGGEAVANPFVSLDGANTEYGHDDITWAQDAGGFSNARYALWYEVATDLAIAYMDLGGDKGNTGGPLTLDVDPATGIVSIQP